MDRFIMLVDLNSFLIQQNALQRFLDVTVTIFLKLFISIQSYIRFYKLICCDSVWREEAYPKISQF
jgi:hypothetical protein